MPWEFVSAFEKDEVQITVNLILKDPAGATLSGDTVLFRLDPTDYQNRPKLRAAVKALIRDELRRRNAVDNPGRDVSGDIQPTP